MNGQEQRRALVRDLAKAVSFDRVIETGTYRGCSTEFFVAVFGIPVTTVESSVRFFTYSQHRLRVHPGVSVELGDSRSILSRLAETRADECETVFAYLDAHWNDDLPLAEELCVLASGWGRAVIMVDDFKVPGDAGYAYDDYGVGKALVESYLPADALAGWSLYYPAAKSEVETGLRRGCCVLVSKSVAGEVAGLASMRLAGIL